MPTCSSAGHIGHAWSTRTTALPYETGGPHSAAVSCSASRRRRRSADDGLDSDEVFDDRQVGCVCGEQRDAVDVGCRGYCEVDRAAPGLATALADCGGEATPFSGDAGVDG